MVVLKDGDAAKGSAACCKQEVAGLGRVGVSLLYLNSKSRLAVTLRRSPASAFLKLTIQHLLEQCCKATFQYFKHTALDKQCSVWKPCFQLASKRKASQSSNSRDITLKSKPNRMHFILTYSPGLGLIMEFSMEMLLIYLTSQNIFSVFSYV